MLLLNKNILCDQVENGTCYIYLSRHMVVCRAAQEVSAPHREYINRKKEILYPIETKFTTEVQLGR